MMNIDEFKEGLNNDDQIRHASINDDPNVATQLLQNALIKQLNIFAPFKTIQLKQNFLPYLSDNTKDLIMKYDEQQKIAKNLKTNISQWMEYKKPRNKVVTEVKNGEKEYNIKLMKGENKMENC